MGVADVKCERQRKAMTIFHRDELVDFLGKVPERWEVLNRDDMSARESKLTLLVFYAGLTEYRFDFFYRLQDHPQGFAFEGQASGRKGFAKVGHAAFSEVYPYWVEAYELHESHWFENDYRPKLELVPRFEILYPVKWRLTELGTNTLIGTSDPLDEIEGYGVISNRKLIDRYSKPHSVRVENFNELADVLHQPVADPWGLHCKRCKDKRYTHQEIAEEWKVRHPESKETIAQLKKRSENYAAEQNRRAKNS
ncbi:hypothetical protein [Planctopirus ephydatiae]|nr:hypothetical protein [Planctopirus ephydatiae]